MLAPIAAVLLFFAAIVVSFWYLRLEEIEREREAVTRDLEYAQQRLRLRLLERQEQLMRLARDVATKETDPEQFMTRAESLVAQYPELEALTWFDAQGKVIASRVTPSLASGARWIAGEFMPAGPTADTARLARELMQPVYSQPKLSGKQVPPLQLHIPLADQGNYTGELLGEYSIDSLLRYGVPNEISSKYAMALLDASDTVLAGQSIPARSNLHGVLPWSNRINQEELPVSPVGNGLVLRAQPGARRSGWWAAGCSGSWAP